MPYLAICLFVIASVFSRSVILSFACFFCQLYALYIVFSRCDAYNVFMHCGIVYDLAKFWGASLRQL